MTSFICLRKQSIFEKTQDNFFSITSRLIFNLSCVQFKIFKKIDTQKQSQRVQTAHFECEFITTQSWIKQEQCSQDKKKLILKRDDFRKKQTIIVLEERHDMSSRNKNRD